MAAGLVESLPLVQRLALSYAPAASRASTLTLLALDTRLAAIVRRKAEPLLAQLKLAWWRDRLREGRALWPAGEPLLDRLAGWRGDPALLVELVNGWEILLSEALSADAIRTFGRGRAAAWSMLAEELGQGGAAEAAGRAAREWALADLTLHLGAWPEAELAREIALSEEWAPLPLPRALRPLAVLRGLAGRALRRGRGEALDGPGAALAALRIGLTGR